MPICTYLSDGQHTQPVHDGELNDLLRWVRDKTGDDWRISEREHTTRGGWFRKPKTIKLYSLYNHVASIEFQIVNFYRPDSDSSINTMVDASLVAAYLYGVLAGVQSHPADQGGRDSE